MFRRRVIVLWLLAVLGAVDVCRAGQEALPPSSDAPARAVKERLAALLGGVPKAAEVGLVVVDCQSGETWFEHQARRPLKPASVMKLFTSAAALDRFGPDFKFETRIYLLKDELLVVGSGDPALGDERIAGRHGQPLHAELDRWVRLLEERGVSSLRTIALDDSVFDQQFRHPDWPDQQATAWYQAPVGGLNFNDNCLDARFAISAGRVTLLLQPELPVGFVHNALRPGAKHKPVASRRVAEDVFEFRGSVTRNDQFKPISARRPDIFFGFALQRALERGGVALQGQVVRRELSTTSLAEAELLDAHTSSMRDIMWRCNTFSQNMFAECLLKSLAAYDPNGSRSGVAGSWDLGARVLRATLERFGIELEGAVLRDGSGLSHENRVTAEQVVRLLTHMDRHQHREQFVASLAQPGQEGTLRHRRWDTPLLHDRLRAKTGTLSAVRALAGYVDRADGHRLAFALLINGSTPGSLRVRVVEALAKAGVDSSP